MRKHISRGKLYREPWRKEKTVTTDNLFSVPQEFLRFLRQERTVKSVNNIS